jgi:flagellar biosynthesis protein FlhG
MAMIVSIGSGKGGVRKPRRQSVHLIGSARQAGGFGGSGRGWSGCPYSVRHAQPSRTLTDFVERRVERLDAVLQQVSAHPFLQLIPGTGDTLATRIPQKRGHKKTFVPAGEQEVTCQ